MTAVSTGAASKAPQGCNAPPKVGLLVLRRRRLGFDPEWGQAMEAAARNALNQSESQPYVPEASIVDDSSLRRALDACEWAGCESLIVIQPTMSDGRLAPVLGQQWQGGLVLWATPERSEGSMISACSLVGAHTFASTLRQLDRPFELVYGDPGEAETTAALRRSLRAVTAVRRLARSQVGLIGYHAPGFIDMHADPYLLSRALGMELRHYSLQEFVDNLASIDDEEMRRDCEQLLQTGLPLQDVNDEDLRQASRYYLLLRRMLMEDALNAVAIRDWGELPDLVGQWPYLAISRLLSEKCAIACEGDVDGAVTCLLGSMLSGNSVYLSDWLEHDQETVTLWHAGNAPLDICEETGTPHGPTFTRHFNNRKPGVVDATLKADEPITIFRLWHCDNEYRLTAFVGKTIAPRRHLLGTNGLARIDSVDVCNLFLNLCHAGMPHHVGVMHGDHVTEMRTLARLIGLTWYGIGEGLG